MPVKSLKILLLALAAIYAGCISNDTSGKKPAISIITIQLANRTDTAGIKSEIEGLAGMVMQVRRGDVPDVVASLTDSGYKLMITPQLDFSQTDYLRAILDTIISFKSPLSQAPALKIVITEKDRDILKLLALRKGQEFPVSLDRSRLQILKSIAVGPSTARKRHSEVVIYIPAIRPLPNVYFNYTIEGDGSKLQDALVAMLGGFSDENGEFKIVADSKPAQALADSLSLNSAVSFDSAAFQINLHLVNHSILDGRSPLADVGMYDSALGRLPGIDPVYYQLLLTPNLCAKMRQYRIR